ncbi:MAG: nitroreductase family protein [Emergencia sp.]
MEEFEMELMDALRARHSVRQYSDRPVEAEILKQLQDEIDACSREGDLHIQLITEEPKAFDSFMAHYGKFSGVRNYIALVGRKTAELDELCGYYGERLVLKAQQLGLNTCWVALTYKKVPGAFQVESGEKLTVVIALGYGKTQGEAHKSKDIEAVSNVSGDTPDWFRQGVEAALLAPTAMNQQKFSLTYEDGKVRAKAGKGFYTRVDLGIVKYHFEIGAGRENFSWA